MNDEIYQLDEVPVMGRPHQAVQRNIVMAYEPLPDVNQNAEKLKQIQRLATTVTAKMLPLYVKTNLSVPEQFGLFVDRSAVKTQNNNFARLQWAFSFLQEHSEVASAAFCSANEVQLLKNPFDEMALHKLYVADDFIAIAGLVIGNQVTPETAAFLKQNRRLQALSNCLILGDRSILLSCLGILIQKGQEYMHEFAQTDISNQQLLALFNQVAYSYFAAQLVHGRQVSSILGFEQQHSDAWFKCR
ncbi:hypothetical protein IV38_GL001911 [Lactobacillus selangorensis]|uniref:Uncharacterized protein n=1 Tax=Lactobacillus selangorensis TaxID=81857 RepID=A0A0R2FPC6_9LACO|nr:hypothetical protein [Lactobacillus selangorensis]KRN27698.1 hypothetical protein IV38_GL001911 [Lactobacillus selangorensis]KRN30337.1 hypothetical protein IV40_GL001926 [Lactobacillus selangorensis]